MFGYDPNPSAPQPTRMSAIEAEQTATTTVTVKATGHVRRELGEHQFEYTFEGDTLGEFLDAFFAEYGCEELLLGIEIAVAVVRRGGRFRPPVFEVPEHGVREKALCQNRCSGNNVPAKIDEPEPDGYRGDADDWFEEDTETETDGGDQHDVQASTGETSILTRVLWLSECFDPASSLHTRLLAGNCVRY